MSSSVPFARKHHWWHRLPPAFAVAVAIAIYALLPGQLVLGPRLAIPLVEGVLLIVVLIYNPIRQTRDDAGERRVSMALDLVVIGANIGALVMLVATVAGPSQDGGSLLIGGIQVWVTNVIGFGLLYWELDGGGAVERVVHPRPRLRLDWQFPQDTDAGASKHWKPHFFEYLYVSLTNSSAFSPTDTMPLRRRAKALMALQGTLALFTSLIVIARAINSLGS